jgi:hypothetical protein
MKTLHVHKNGQWQEVVGAPSDLQGYYTSAETDAAILVSRNECAADLDAVQTQVLFAIEETGKQTQAKIDLKADKAETYTKTEVDEALANAATGGTVDLNGYAKREDNQQLLLAKTITAEGYGFGGDVTPSVAVTYTDTGAGYGERLVLATAADIEYLVYQSDLEVLNALLPRVEAIESKGAAGVDLAPYVTLETAETRYAPKATTYTKTEADGKFLTLVDVNGVYAFAAETYKKSETYTKAEVETRLLEVPSPMKYLQWGGVFQKMPAGNAKDKWFGAGLIPSIQIVKGKRYRLEMTTKFGPLNADYKECWIGFRFNYRTLNELPCTKQPLVTMGGFGHTTVTRARAAIAATAVATTTPTRADRFRFLAVDDWASAEDIIDYAVEFEADQDIASANFVPEICFGGTWGLYPTNFEGIVAVFRQMD